MPCTPSARCFTAAHAVCRCTRSASHSACSSSGVSAYAYSDDTSPIYWNMNDSVFSTPCCTFTSAVRYSFIKCASTVNGPQLSATTASATVEHTRVVRSCTRRFDSRMCAMSCGPTALAIYPNVFTAARRIALRGARSSSTSRNAIRIHSFSLTCRAPRSAIRPTRSIAASCTRSFWFRRMGVTAATSSPTGGCIASIPTTDTTPRSPTSTDASASGYSSPRHSNSTDPRCASISSSPHDRITGATSATSSATCARAADDLWSSRHLITAAIWCSYGRARRPSADSIAAIASSTARADAVRVGATPAPPGPPPAPASGPAEAAPSS